MTGRAASRRCWRACATAFGWTEVAEQGKIIGLTRKGANISLEPGGQFELSGAMMASVHDTAAELDNHLEEVRAVADPMGVRFMGIGAAPEWTHAEMPVMPKGRYRLMTDYMGRVGTHGTQMMYRTSTVQVNLDFSSEADMVKKLRVAIALQPVATALFASSPFFEGKPNGHKSWRSRIWRGLDDSRTGMLPFVFEDGMGFQRYVDWVLDVPMYFVYRDGKYINALGQSFRDFLNGELPALPGEEPTLSDWADHMTTVFPEARVKKYIEMRGADCGDRAHLVALPAFWTGLMYDTAALDAAWDLVRGWDAETREGLRVAASVSALQGEAGGVKLLDLARAAVGAVACWVGARGAWAKRRFWRLWSKACEPRACRPIGCWRPITANGAAIWAGFTKQPVFELDLIVKEGPRRMARAFFVYASVGSRFTGPVGVGRGHRRSAWRYHHFRSVVTAWAKPGPASGRRSPMEKHNHDRIAPQCGQRRCGQADAAETDGQKARGDADRRRTGDAPGFRAGAHRLANGQDHPGKSNQNGQRNCKVDKNAKEHDVFLSGGWIQGFAVKAAIKRGEMPAQIGAKIRPKRKARPCQRHSGS